MKGLLPDSPPSGVIVPLVVHGQGGHHAGPVDHDQGDQVAGGEVDRFGVVTELRGIAGDHAAWQVVVAHQIAAQVEHQVVVLCATGEHQLFDRTVAQAPPPVGDRLDGGVDEVVHKQIQSP